MPPKTSQGPGETYADPGYQKDGQKRYALTLNGVLNQKRIRAAYSYINQKDNQSPYTAAQVADIISRIQAAGKKVGVKFADAAS
jgi:hypothetical protein